jgi:membrane-associated PAP2 superfamily phosphatase
MSINREIQLTLLLLVFTIIIFGITNIDRTVQDSFFDYSNQRWILDRNLQPYRFIFYDGIKKLLITIGVIFLTILIILTLSESEALATNNRNFFVKIAPYKKGIIIVILSAIFIPLIVGGLKKATNMPCPKNEIHYGGEYPSIKVWETYPKKFQKCNRVCCFPAGHASGGFALMSLFFLFKRRRNRVIALMGALTVGWSMGIYKMLIGDHFLSHTVITMILAWLIVLVIKKIVDRDGTI